MIKHSPNRRNCLMRQNWGNVSIAPPMLDLANIIRIDSTEWDISTLSRGRR